MEVVTEVALGKGDVSLAALGKFCGRTYELIDQVWRSDRSNPPERQQAGMCGLLNFNLYGARGAAQAAAHILPLLRRAHPSRRPARRMKTSEGERSQLFTL